MSCLRVSGVALIILWLVFFGYMITREATEDSFNAINRDNGRVSQCDQDILKKLRTAQLKIETLEEDRIKSQRLIADAELLSKSAASNTEINALESKLRQQIEVNRRLTEDIDSLKKKDESESVVEQKVKESEERLNSLHYVRTKRALNWFTKTAEEERDNSIRTFLKNSEKLKKEFPSSTGTSWNCYELSDEPRVNAFTRLSAGGVCVFENICFYSNNFWVVFDSNSHPTFPMTHAQRWDWPQTLNGFGPRVHAQKVSNAAEYFQKNEIKWEEEFSWLITNSYSSHTAHWFETISQIFLARNVLPPEIIPEAKSLYFTTHGRSMFDWQVGTLLASLIQHDKPEFIYSDSMTYSESAPKCFKKAAIPGYQFYFFPSKEQGMAYKKQTYEFLNLPIPTEVPKVITIASRSGKRTIENEHQLVEFLQSKGVATINVVKFGSMNFQEQVKSMHGTGLLIGIHGADLTNEMFLPNGAAILEINPYRFYDNRFFGVAPLMGIKYFSYNCGTSTCSSGHGGGSVQNWPISGYPPIQDPQCNQDLGSSGMRDSNVKIDFNDFEIVIGEVFAYLNWGPKDDLSAWT